MVSMRLDTYDIFGPFLKIADGSFSHIGFRGYIIIATSPNIMAIGALAYVHVAISRTFTNL